MGRQKPLTVREQYLFREMYPSTSTKHQEKNWEKRRRLKRFEKRYWVWRHTEDVKQMRVLGLEGENAYKAVAHFIKRGNFRHKKQYYDCYDSLAFANLLEQTKDKTEAEMVAELL